MHAAARQRYYNRGSNANWKAERAINTGDGAFIGRFFGYTGLVITGGLVALSALLGPFHMFVMLVLTSPLWGGAAILLAVFNE
jgi:hypothetical protein